MRSNHSINSIIGLILKTPLAALILAITTISCLYVISSLTPVGVYESYKGKLEYVDSNAIVNVHIPIKNKNINILDCVIYETNDSNRYSCKYLRTEEIGNSRELIFTVNDLSFQNKSITDQQVYVEIKTNEIPLLQKLLNNRGK